jgi:hypothetical protein
LRPLFERPWRFGWDVPFGYRANFAGVENIIPKAGDVYALFMHQNERREIVGCTMLAVKPYLSQSTTVTSLADRNIMAKSDMAMRSQPKIKYKSNQCRNHSTNY